MQEYVKINKANGVGTITFFSELHNAMSSSLLGELVNAIDALSTDEEVKVILLKSDGDKVFCSGASFNELKAIATQDDAERFFNGFAKVINAMRKSSKIIVCRVHGKAVGGGVGLAAAADYTVATIDASIRLSELKIGIGPFVIGPAVKRKIGISAFSHLTLNPDEWQTAAWAKTKGLYQECFETIAQADEYLAFYLKKMTAYSPLAMNEIKKFLWQDTDHWDKLLEVNASISGRLVLDEFAQGAIKNFLKK